MCSSDLQKREDLMQRLHDQDGVWTDQWRVYGEITQGLDNDAHPLRLFLQASAGTGKSFLLEAVYMWCYLHGHSVQACAPTGIAAARLRVSRTPVSAFTLHYLFGLSVDLVSTIDPSRPDDAATQRLTKMTVLIVDEVSMVDDGAWFAMKDQLTAVGALPRGQQGASRHPPADDFGRAHILLSGDYKQLPPATSRPPCIAADMQILERFDFRVLRQNRRLSSEDPASQQRLEDFHQTLEDIAWNHVTPAVRDFFVSAYLRGASRTQYVVDFEGSTACFTKRRYRDRWNKRLLERSAKKHGRSLKVKAVFATRGTEKQWIREAAAAEIRRTVRSQCLTTLRLAGQWLEDPPMPGIARPHCMRAMLVANIDVAGGFANGALGRIVHWGPDTSMSGTGLHSCLANVPGVQVRFYHEEALKSDKAHFLPLVDFMDIEPRKETVATARGKPAMLQLPGQPAYALTIHKVQAMTIKHFVDGCLEGVFAHGQIYVLVSRVTDPEHFFAVGIPPSDLLEPVARAWAAAGLDVDACFLAAARVTEEWEYSRTAPGKDPCAKVAERLQATKADERRVPLRLRELEHVLNPQRSTAEVLHALLGWIDRADEASQNGQPRPAVQRDNGAPLFPEDEWWLTELERRRPVDADKGGDDDGCVNEDDVTWKPEDAGAQSSSSSEPTGDDSDASLPAGPPPPRAPAQKHSRQPSASTSTVLPAGTQTGSASAAGALPPSRRTRLRAKTSSSHASVPVAQVSTTSRLQQALSSGSTGHARGSSLSVDRRARHGPAQVSMHVDAVPDLPANLRREAKRGDKHVSVES